MVESLINGQADSSESVNVHDVIAQVVEDVIFRQIGHYLIEEHDVSVGDSTACHVVVIQRHFLIR